jgi:ABC-type glycerol-3-phosphate transport system substrate-binding protein
VLREAGISKQPASIDEFIADLRRVRDKTNKIPLSLGAHARRHGRRHERLTRSGEH